MKTLVEFRGDRFDTNTHSNTEAEALGVAFRWLQQHNLVLSGIYESSGVVDQEEIEVEGDVEDCNIVSYPQHDQYILTPKFAAMPTKSGLSM